MNKRQRVSDTATLPLPDEMAMEIACHVHCASDVWALAHTCRDWYRAVVTYKKRIWEILKGRHFPGKDASKRTYTESVNQLASAMLGVFVWWYDTDESLLSSELVFGHEQKPSAVSVYDMDAVSSSSPLVFEYERGLDYGLFPIPPVFSVPWVPDYPTTWDHGHCGRALNLSELFDRFLRTVDPRGRIQIIAPSSEPGITHVGVYMQWSVRYWPSLDSLWFCIEHENSQ